MCRSGQQWDSVNISVSRRIGIANRQTNSHALRQTQLISLKIVDLSKRTLIHVHVAHNTPEKLTMPLLCYRSFLNNAKLLMNVNFHVLEHGNKTAPTATSFLFA